MIEIDDSLLDYVSQKAKENIRKRVFYSFHKSPTEPLQRFLNAVEPGTYIRPHKHTDSYKTEVVIILRGKVLIVEFNDKGETINNLILNFDSGKKGVEFPPNTWHSIIALEESSVLYEIKGGPFVLEADKTFASWAPEEGTEEARKYINKILLSLQITI